MMTGDASGGLATAERTRAHRAIADARRLYRREVVRVAEALRRELQTGELGEWEDGDETAFPRGEAPRHLFETEVAARFVGSLDCALVVLSASPHARELMPDFASTTGFTTTGRGDHGDGVRRPRPRALPRMAAVSYAQGSRRQSFAVTTQHQSSPRPVR